LIIDDEIHLTNHHQPSSPTINHLTIILTSTITINHLTINHLINHHLISLYLGTWKFHHLERYVYNSQLDNPYLPPESSQIPSYLFIYLFEMVDDGCKMVGEMVIDRW